MSDKPIMEQVIKFSGNILLFYAFDVGDEIDLEKVKNKKSVTIKSLPLSQYFKNYHIPLSFDIEKEKQDEINYDCISSKIHHFGVLSFCYKVPFKSSFDELKINVIDIKKRFDEISKVDVKSVFSKILFAIKKSRFYNLENFYFAVQLNPSKSISSPEEFKKIYKEKIASLLRLETQVLSEYQTKEILSSTTGYSGKDMLIIDNEAAFIYDEEYLELLEFFEFANIQKLELQYFDRILDEKLNFFYMQQSYKVPLMAYIPLLGERVNLPVSLLAQLRVDISVITERLENSIKMAGDYYFSKVYSMLREKLSLNEWRDSINRKLEIVKDLYTVYQDRLDVIHEEILTLVIIILIALEAILAFLG